MSNMYVSLEARIQSFLELLGIVVPEDAGRERIIKEARELFGIDGLTGLTNKSYLIEAFRDEATRAERHGHPLSFLFLDIDDFGMYNNTYGHEQGDVALRFVASLLNRNRRRLDTVARYGGEEFCLLLPDTPLDGAIEMATNVVARVKESRIEEYVGFEEKKEKKYSNNNRYHQLTVSVGVANFPSTTTTPFSLNTDADEAMYKAKKSGKDRFAVFDINHK